MFTSKVFLFNISVIKPINLSVALDIIINLLSWNRDLINKFEINGEIVEVDDNSFGYVLEVKSGQNRIKAEVFETSGKTTGLEFIIKAP